MKRNRKFPKMNGGDFTDLGMNIAGCLDIPCSPNCPSLYGVPFSNMMTSKASTTTFFSLTNIKT